MADLSLINTISQLSALSPLFTSTTNQSFANASALAAEAEAALETQRSFPSQQAVALSGLASQAQALISAASPLAFNTLANTGLLQASSPVLSFPFTQTSASSSSPTKVSATSTQGATQTSYQIGVSQLATAQVDTSTALASGGATINAGALSINVTVGGITTPVNFTNVAGTDQDALAQFAQALNAANLGLTAAATTSGGFTTLTITADDMGTNSAFTLQDVPVGAGNLLFQAFGSSTVAPGSAGVTTAQNALYTVNGVTYSGQSNSFTLDNGRLSIELLATTTSPATVTVSANNGTLADTVTSFVTAYNNFVTFLDANSDTLSPSVLQQAQSLVNAQAAGLAGFGVTINSDGTLAINEDTLSSVAESNAPAVQAVFEGPSGLASQLSGLAKEIGVSAQNLFALAIPAAVDLATLPTRLAELFGNVLFGEQLAAGHIVNLHG